MALVTVQRSPSIGNSPQSSLWSRAFGVFSHKSNGQLSKCSFGKLSNVIPIFTKTRILKLNQDSGAGGSLDDEEATKNGKSLSECYFAGKGAAVVLPPHDRLPPAPPSPPALTSSNDIQHHLQSMFYLLRSDETLKMAVKLESVHCGRTRYLVVVSRLGRQQTEESCLLGIDCNHSTTVGLVLRVLADTAITLDGDGGFSVSVCGKQHIFKPVSVQAMWSALQTLHKVSAKAREHNYFLGGLTHDWVSHYENCITSDRSCLNEWHAMDNLESRRPPSPDSIRHKPGEREETERVIRAALKEIMMSVDLDEVTSKQVRAKLEESLDMDLGEFKPFIDQEMLVILGQMDEATEIFSHVYLGSEWNASNLEELNKNGVCHILNVTREIDNFFPGMFDYLNIRVYDDDKTDLLKHWDDTFKYITKAKQEGSKVLVHCKMGVSRSASVVIAYAMKAYSWDLKKAMNYVQNKRNCIKPNSNFISQLETYEGILDAMKNKEKLQRSKSETNLKRNSVRNGVDSCTESRSVSEGEVEVERRDHNPEERLPLLHGITSRPKSWSPDHATANNIFTTGQQPISMSIERLPTQSSDSTSEMDTTPMPPPPPPPLPPSPPLPRNISNVHRMPCGNGQAYSVSQNKAFHLCPTQNQENGDSTVRRRVDALESQQNLNNSNTRNGDRRALVLNLTSHTDSKKSGKDLFSSQVDKVFDKEECTNHEVSRQLSWSSNDSALGETVSRHSSWGSGDNRSGVLPSRNSSWGSYDIRRDRSSPEVGIVKNLKKEFEAKSSSSTISSGLGSGSSSSSSGGVSGDTSQSLPSSPVSERGHHEDRSVRRLVGRYEKVPNPTRRPPVPLVKAPQAPAPHKPSTHPKPAHKKQQQGRTHPLTRLSHLHPHKSRHPNPVYNTM